MNLVGSVTYINYMFVNSKFNLVIHSLANLVSNVANIMFFELYYINIQGIV